VKKLVFDIDLEDAATCYNNFFDFGQKARVFGSVKQFQPSLIFAGMPLCLSV